jgi:hypothetical protein
VFLAVVLDGPIRCFDLFNNKFDFIASMGVLGGPEAVIEPKIVITKMPNTV